MKFQLDESLFNKYKQPLTESKLNESASDGWDEEFKDEPVLSDLEKFIYEIRNAIKGAYTRAKTYKELADYIENLADELSDFASEVRLHPEDEEDND